MSADNILEPESLILDAMEAAEGDPRSAGRARRIKLQPIPARHSCRKPWKRSRR